MDDLLDFINSQHHSDDQLDQVLQTYQTYTESQSPTRQVNAHITYHVAQANITKLCINLLLIGEKMVALQVQM